MAKSAPAAQPQSVEEALGYQQPQQPQEPPHIKATYSGSYYEGTGAGMKSVPYEETVKVPFSWLNRTDLSPIGMFLAMYAKRPQVLGSRPGFSGVMTCSLQATSGLPDYLADDIFLSWTADRASLVQYVSSRRLPVMVELYSTADELRDAIRRYTSEPEAFRKEQEKRSNSPKLARRAMEDDLVALGY